MYIKQRRHQFFNSLSIRFTVIIILVQLGIATITGSIYATNFTKELQDRTQRNAQVPIALANDGVLEYSNFANREEMESIVGQDIINAFVVGVNDNIFFSVNGEFLGTSFQDYVISEALEDFDLFTLTEITSITTADDNIIVASPLLAEDQRTARFYAFFEISNAELIEQRNELIQLFVLGGLATVVITTIVIYFLFDRTVYRRIQITLDVMGNAANGNLSVRVPNPSSDEIGSLQEGTNVMIEQLQSQVNTLEERVAKRTHDLTVSASISRQTTTILNPSRLFEELVELTAEAFGFYQVSIFKYDKDNLQLVAASGESGDKMIAAGLSFSLSSPGIVPSAARKQLPVVSNDVSVDPEHSINRFRPDTRSEVALPIMFANELLGVLDLQSTELNRFSDSDLQLLRAFADQIAIALRNAALFEQAELARIQAEHSDQVKSAFLASMSHELRTPLNAVINFTHFVVDGDTGPVNEQQTELLTEVIGSAKHLLNLINDVLDMSKIESGSLNLFIQNDVSIDVLLKSAMTTGQGLLNGKPVQLHADIADNLPLVRADKQRILQILLNVISNACKFTDEGEITVRAHRADDAIIIAVTDTGPGIAPEDQDMVFEAFKQTSTGLRQAGGTGLGMPIARSLAEAHGGRLWLESEPGKGATFYFSIPVEPQELVPKLA